MGKEQDTKKEGKKAPLKTLKEKRAEKKAKKAARVNPPRPSFTGRRHPSGAVCRLFI
ncbi:MAG: hypothetical protein V1913_09390 [Fibrobacterota bacterium]